MVVRSNICGHALAGHTKNLLVPTASDRHLALSDCTDKAYQIRPVSSEQPPQPIQTRLLTFIVHLMCTHDDDAA
jgi:hypothetical protein